MVATLLPEYYAAAALRGESSSKTTGLSRAEPQISGESLSVKDKRG